MKRRTSVSILTLSTGLFSLLFLCILSACSSSPKHEIEDIKRQNDSLQSIVNQSNQQLTDMNNYFISMASCIDSIVQQESILLVRVDPETNYRYTKAEIRERLNLLSDVITRQRIKIQELYDSLSIPNTTDTISSSGLNKMVKFLNTQLEEKEAKIQSLLHELNIKNKNIKQLNTRIDNLTTELTTVNETNSNLITAVVEQTKMLNEGYILIADKKTLQALGVITKGNLFKKSKFVPANIDKSKCQVVDISMVSEIPLASSKPQILSLNPEGSYTLENSTSGKVLKILDPAKFWSISNYLIIQL